MRPLAPPLFPFPLLCYETLSGSVVPYTMFISVYSRLLLYLLGAPLGGSPTFTVIVFGLFL